MKSRAATRASLGAIAVTWAAAAVVGAADTWTNTSGNGLWATGANWQDGMVPTLGDAVVFPMPVPGSPGVTLPGTPASAASLNFSDSYTLNSGTLSMPTNAPITVGPGAVAIINSQISANGLAKNGSGTLVLGGDNSNSLFGDIHINTGVLRYSSDAQVGSQWSPLWIHDTLEINATFTSMKRMEPANGTIRVTAGNWFTLGSSDQFGFSQSDALYLDGPGTIVRIGHTSRMGTTYIIGGTTKLQNGDFGYGPYVVSNGTLEVGTSPFGTFLSNTTTLGANGVLRAAATPTLTAPNVFGAAGVTINPTLAAIANATLEVTLKGTPGNAASVFHIAGPGTVRLMQSGLTYPGGWSIDSGTLHIASHSQLGQGTSAIPIGSGGRLRFQNMTLARALNLGDGSGILTGSAGSSGFLNVAAGAEVSVATVGAADILTLTGPADRLNGGAGGKLRVNGPGRLHLANATSFAGDWWLSGGATLRAQHANSLGLPGSNVVFGGGPATLEIGEAITIANNIAFNDGTIRAANGNAALTGTVTVGAGANVTFATSSPDMSLTIGDGPNDITFGGNLGDSVINVGPNSGPVILTHPNDVKSSWVVKASSSLHISDDAQLGPMVNTRPVKLDGVGAELRTLAPINTARGIVANHGIFFTNGFDSSYGSVTGSGGLFMKVGDGTLTVNHVRATALSAAEGVVKIKPDGTAAGVSTLNTVSVGTEGQLDLTNNALILKSMPLGTFDGEAYDGVTGLVAKGRAFGTWNGLDGIITSEPDAQLDLTGLAVATGEQTVFAGSTLRGTSVSATDIVVLYTYVGDANLDGQIDAGDYGILDFFVQVEGASGYANGDFNYDGFIDAGDYGIIDYNVQMQGPPIVMSGSAAGAAELSAVAAVPEPASLLGIVWCGGSLMLGRRRRGW